MKGRQNKIYWRILKGYAHGPNVSRGRLHDRVGKMFVKDQGGIQYSGASRFQSHEARMPDSVSVPRHHVPCPDV